MPVRQSMWQRTKLHGHQNFKSTSSFAEDPLVLLYDKNREQLDRLVSSSTFSLGCVPRKKEEQAQEQELDLEEKIKRWRTAKEERRVAGMRYTIIQMFVSDILDVSECYRVNGLVEPSVLLQCVVLAGAHSISDTRCRTTFHWKWQCLDGWCPITTSLAAVSVLGSVTQTQQWDKDLQGSIQMKQI